MRKRILLVSMLVLTLLLLMPSIPAIQLNTIKDKAFSDLVDNGKYFGNLNQQEVEELIISFKEKLFHTQTRSEIVEIFNEMKNSINIETSPYFCFEDSDIGVLTPNLWLLYLILDIITLIIEAFGEGGIVIGVILIIGFFICAMLFFVYVIFLNIYILFFDKYFNQINK